MNNQGNTPQRRSRVNRNAQTPSGEPVSAYPIGTQQMYNQTPKSYQPAPPQHNAPQGYSQGFIPQSVPVQPAYQQPEAPAAASAQYAEQNGNWYVTPPQNGAKKSTPKKTQKKKNPPSGNRSGNGWILLLIALVFIAGGVAYAVSTRVNNVQELVNPYINTFLDTVSVDGINLAGKTFEEGSQLVWEHVNNRKNSWYVRLRSPSGSYRDITADMLGMSFDPTAALNQAWAVGHSGVGTVRDQLKEIEIANSTEHAFYSAHQSADTTQVDNILAALEAAAYKAPSDAYIISFNADNSSELFTYQQEVYGRYLDTTEIREQIMGYIQRLESGEVLMQTHVLEPAVTVAQLSQTVALRCRAITPISSKSPEDRTTNIRTAFSRINGMSIPNKGKFSFNSTCKARTTANGYLPAVEYVYGAETTGIGGGVCQASTTVYLAAIQSGMTITKRVPHSMSVSYTELGMDATVNSTRGHEIDFTFKNESGGTIYISAHVIKSSTNKKNLMCEVCIYGPSLGNTSYQLISETVEVLTKPEEPIMKVDKEGVYVTYTDQTKVIKGRDGYVVDAWLITYENNVEVARKKVSTDTYPNKADTVYTGATLR